MNLRKALLSSGFVLPDYRNSVLNVVASIVRALGGKCPHPHLVSLPPSKLKEFQRIIYLVVDGLGVYQLKELLSLGHGRRFFNSVPYLEISTVFPATTATAVTTITTGSSPREHAILGWYLNLPDLGLVSTILSTSTRTEQPIADKSFDLARYLRIPSYLRTVSCRKELFMDPDLGSKPFSRCLGAWKRLRPLKKLSQLHDLVLRFSGDRGKAVAYAYWPLFDTLCHRHGCFSPETKKHFDAIDRALARCRKALRGSRTLLLVLADHGLVDCPLKKQIDIARIPLFLSTLATLPAGDPRHLICYVRASKLRTFKKCVDQNLSKACMCVSGSQILEKEFLGPGKNHPELEARIGDFHLLAKENYAFSCSIPFLKTKKLLAHHGGMTEAEMRVPLFVVEP